MGTVVFPAADYKFYLEATVEERVKRRYDELRARGSTVDFQEVERDLMLRDRQDRERKIAPLKTPDRAIIIDSTNMTISQVVEKMTSIVEGR